MQTDLTLDLVVGPRYVRLFSRDVKQMLLKLVELRSSDWGRVHAAAAANYATPDNDPNYFMVCGQTTVSVEPAYLCSLSSLCAVVTGLSFYLCCRMSPRSTPRMARRSPQPTQVDISQCLLLLSSSTVFSMLLASATAKSPQWIST